MSSDVTLIIVTHNSAPVLGQCLEACAAPGLRRVIVDNASSDDTLAIARAADPPVTVIALDANTGYGRAANRGLATVETPYALLLNPDVLFPPDRIRALVALHRAHQPLALSACLLEVPAADGSVKLEQFTPVDPEAEVAFVNRLIGAAMLFSMDVLRRVGFFDENIFLYYEDDDLCLRLRRAGERIAIFPRIRATHFYSQSSPKTRPYQRMKSWHFTWSRLYFRQKERGRPAACHLAVRLALRDLRILLRLRRAGRRDEETDARACSLRASIAFLFGRPADYQPGKD